MCKIIFEGEVMNVLWWVFEKFSQSLALFLAMKNWQVVAVVEIANLQRPRRKITVEYLAWFIESVLGSQLCGIIV